MRKVKNENYVTFTATETVVTLKEARGQLRTNDMGEFFLRNFADGRFSCVSPDLERQLIDLGVTVGTQVGIARLQHGRSIIWKCRRIGEVAEMPGRQHRTYRHDGKVQNAGLPECCFAAVESTDQQPDPEWYVLSVDKPTPAPAVAGEALAPEAASGNAPTGQSIAIPNTLEALGQLYEQCCRVVAKLNLPTGFARAEAATTLFIAMDRRAQDAMRQGNSDQRRKPVGRVSSVRGYVNGKVH